MSAPKKHHAILIAVCVFAAAAPLHGQSKGQYDKTRRRNDCRLADQVIETGQPATKKEWAYGYI